MAPVADAGTGLAVAICTRDRPEQLRRALRSLRAQVDPADEVMVVDNAPGDDGARRLVEAEFPEVRYVREPAPGLDFARNRALAAACLDLLAFLDDDAVAAPDWTRAVRARFLADPALGATTARVLPLTLATPAQRLFEANGGFARGEAVIRLPPDGGGSLHGVRAPQIAWIVSMGSGCGLALRRQAALAVGGFDEALDMGAVLPGGGDHDMMWRLLRAGHAILYDPGARLFHEHRADMARLERQIIGHQRALVAFLVKSVGSGPMHLRLSVLAFLGWRLMKPGVRILRRLAGRDPLPLAMLARMWPACWLALPAYARARRTVAGQRKPESPPSPEPSPRGSGTAGISPLH